MSELVSNNATVANEEVSFAVDTIPTIQAGAYVGMSEDVVLGEVTNVELSIEENTLLRIADNASGVLVFVKARLPGDRVVVSHIQLPAGDYKFVGLAYDGFTKYVNPQIS